MTAAPGSPARISSWIDRRGSVRALAVLRIAAGGVLLIHLRPFLEMAAEGETYADRFYQPYATWYPELPETLYLALLWAAVPAAIMLSAGLLTRWAAVYSAAFVGYSLFLSETHFHHNRTFLLMLLIGLAVLPVGRHISIDAWLGRGRSRPRGTRLWPLWLMRFEAATVYAASGFSKLIDPDWWGGTVTRLRVERYGDLAADRGVPDWLLDLLSTQGFHWWFAKIVVLTELAIGLGFLWRRTRLGAVWLAIAFHLAIEVSASVQVFSYAGLAALVIWVTPRDHDRTVVLRGDSAAARALGRAVRWGDWTGRFRLERQSGPGPAITLQDRPDHTGEPVVRTGKQAARLVLSRLPLTFWFVAPLLLRHRRTAAN
jgi:hypothetical protein